MIIIARIRFDCLTRYVESYLPHLPRDPIYARNKGENNRELGLPKTNMIIYEIRRDVKTNDISPFLFELQGIFAGYENGIDALVDDNARVLFSLDIKDDLEEISPAVFFPSSFIKFLSKINSDVEVGYDD